MFSCETSVQANARFLLLEWCCSDGFAGRLTRGSGSWDRVGGADFVFPAW